MYSTVYCNAHRMPLMMVNGTPNRPETGCVGGIGLIGDCAGMCDGFGGGVRGTESLLFPNQHLRPMKASRTLMSEYQSTSTNVPRVTTEIS